MSIQPAIRSVGPGPRAQQGEEGDAPRLVPGAPAAQDEALDFVRFCYRRRRVGWPEIYDEMSAVAARGAFRGLGYAELAERGISFCLSDLPRLVALTERVVAEDRTTHEPAARPGPITLSVVSARG